MLGAAWYPTLVKLALRRGCTRLAGSGPLILHLLRAARRQKHWHGWRPCQPGYRELIPRASRRCRSQALNCSNSTAALEATGRAAVFHSEGRPSFLERLCPVARPSFTGHLAIQPDHNLGRSPGVLSRGARAQAARCCTGQQDSGTSAAWICCWRGRRLTSRRLMPKATCRCTLLPCMGVAPDPARCDSSSPQFVGMIAAPCQSCVYGLHTAAPPGLVLRGVCLAGRQPMSAYSLATKAPGACLAANARGQTPVDAAVACEQGEARPAAARPGRSCWLWA